MTKCGIWAKAQNNLFSGHVFRSSSSPHSAELSNFRGNNSISRER